MEQGTDEWFQARLGKVTASRVSDVIAKTKSGWGASRANYAAELIAERLTGVQAQSYTNAAMQWGLDTEPQARAAYEFFRDASVEQIGFVDHPKIPMTGASPDGYVGTQGMVEIKCPNTATHINTLLSKTIPTKYIIQMHWQMACAERSWCDYISFDPRMPEDLRLFVKRVQREEQRVVDLQDEVCTFLIELNDTIEELRSEAEKLAQVEELVP